MAAISKFQDKRFLQVLLSLLLLMVILLSLFGDKGYLQLRVLQAKEQALEAEIQILKQDKEIWELRLKALRTNPSYLETLAREELGLIKSDEKIILTEGVLP